MKSLRITGYLLLLLPLAVLGQTAQVSPSSVTSWGGQVSNSSVQVFGNLGQPMVFPVAGPTASAAIGFIPQIRALNLNPTAVEDPVPVESPLRFELKQNYPNPFNPSTTIPFSLARQSRAALEIFNLLGQVVRSFDLSAYGPGSYELFWDGRDAVGQTVPSGTFFCRLSSGQTTTVQRMLLLK